MHRFSVLFLFHAAASAFECGKVPIDNPLESRVVGGHPAAEGNWPFVAYIHDFSNGHFCSGSIIGPRYVLAAAHCVDNSSRPMQSKINESVFQVRFGSVSKTSGMRRNVRRVVLGRNWHRASHPKAMIDDIAILELNDAIDYNDYAQPVCLPKSFRERPGDSGYFVGWGKRNIVPEPHNQTTDYEGSPDVANENIVTFRKWKHCNPVEYGPWFHKEDYICVGQYMRMEHSGDSGGSLMVNRKGIWFEVGTLSGGKKSDGRGSSYFVRVTAHCKWIEEATRGEVKCVRP